MKTQNKTLNCKSLIFLCKKPGIILIEMLVILVLAGCRPLPDVGPFIDASYQLQSVVATSGITVESELRLMHNGTKYADEFKSNWEVRNKAFAGITDYTSSLKAIVDAGNQGSASAQKVADSVSALVKTAGVTLPGSPEAVAVVTDAAKFISAQIALIRAAKSLEQSMETAQPVVEIITQLIATDLKSIEDIFISASTSNENYIRTSDEFKYLIGYRNEILKLIGTSNLSDPNTYNQQVQLNQILQANNEWYLMYLAKRNEINNRLRVGRALIQAATQSALDWGVTHRKLIMALKERRPVNTDSLVQAAVDIQNILRKVREI